jgi:hypothetical protein
MTWAGKAAIGLRMNETAQMGADVVKRVVAAVIFLQEEARLFEMNRQGGEILGAAQREGGWIGAGRLIAREA